MDFRRITKNGHSNGVNLPTHVLRAIRLQTGDAVAIEVVDQSIVITRALSSRQLFEREAKPAVKRHG